MGAQSVVIPLHTYMANGQADRLCAYLYGNTTCNQSKDSYVHVVRRSGTVNKADLMKSDNHPFQSANDSDRCDAIVVNDEGQVAPCGWAETAYRHHVDPHRPQTLVQVVDPDEQTWEHLDGNRKLAEQTPMEKAREHVDQVQNYLNLKGGAVYPTRTGSLTVDSPPTTLQGAVMYFDQCTDLMARKNEDYKNAWQGQGYMGNIARILSKADRLRAMLWSDIPPLTKPEETIEDTLRDLANLTYFAERNWREGNRWGDTNG